jgi:hypothetical protein
MGNMEHEALLELARALPAEPDLQRHIGTIVTLRSKSLSWRQIADFFCEHGVPTEHTKVYRAYTKHRSLTMEIPSALEYAAAFQNIKMSNDQRKMLGHHYTARNRTVTYTELAKAAGAENYRAANSAYGRLGKMLGEATGYTFPIASERGEPFYSGALGIDAPRREQGEYRLMMHHEVADALHQLEWFK